jgi:hypothetical protein
MILRYERSGGFTGMRVAVDIDTATLSSDERTEVAGHDDAADFYEMPDRIAPPGGADDLVHVLTIESEGRQHTVEASGPGTPQALDALLKTMGRLARAAASDRGTPG